MNIVINIKKDWPLAFYLVGTAIIGYLGYHVIRWLINKCQNIEAIDQAAGETLQLLNKSPKNGRNTLEIGTGQIQSGYGEYVVFQTDKDKTLTKETYEKVYEIFDRYSPAAIINSGDEDAQEQCAQRYEAMRGKVKEIDSSLEIAFVPRTLYELVFIRKCIAEDLKANKICSYLDHTTQLIMHAPEQIPLIASGLSPEELSEMQEKDRSRQAKKKCWHLAYFDDAANHNHYQPVKDTAYRLNQAIVKRFSPQEGGWTYEQLSQFTENEIAFLKEHYAAQNPELGSSTNPGPTTNFGTESRRGCIRPMGIRNDQDAQPIRDAVALECSKIAQDAFLIYRGADFDKDAPYHLKDPEKAFSTSWATGLFAGCLYNGEDAPYYYMRNGSDGYAIPVPFEKLNTSPFFIPTSNAIAQLFGTGEIFHVRSMGWQGMDIKDLCGIQMGEQRVEHLQSALAREELVSQYKELKDQAIQLK